MSNQIEAEELSGIKKKLHEIIFEADTFGGKLFDICLLVAIVLSVIAVCLETLFPEIPSQPTPSELRIIHYLDVFEWVITIGFSIEYILRLYVVTKPMSYVKSFYGIVDVIAILPTYLEVFLGVGSSFAVVRALRLLRIFRIFKLVTLLSEFEELWRAVWSARSKVIVFISVVIIAITIAGAGMYEIEGTHRVGNEDSGFESIPHSMYWAMVTMSTVGYGDIVPQTALGKILATFLIMLGYSMIIIPTGFVSAEFIGRKAIKQITTQSCPSCITEGHDMDAKFCKYCGANI